ncbi:MAG: hypothetical protein V1672_00565 [Candidatus Diapherotrites archaeon]
MPHKRYEKIGSHRIGHEHHFYTEHEKWPARVTGIDMQKAVTLITRKYLQKLTPLSGLMKYDSKIQSMHPLKPEDVPKVIINIESFERQYHAELANLYLRNLPEDSIREYIVSIPDDIFTLINSDILRTVSKLDPEKKKIVMSACAEKMKEEDEWLD